MNYRQTEQPTLYHAHAARYLREAGGDRRKARRAALADRDAVMGRPEITAFYNAVVMILDQETER